VKLWTRRVTGRHRAGGEQTEGPPLANEHSPETERAIQAAREAARDLTEARRVRRKIDRLGDEIDAETSRNGFRLIIESALGSGAS
jgi:hypothetical protein